MVMFKRKPWKRPHPRPSIMSSNKLRNNVLRPWSASMKSAHRSEALKRLVHIASGRRRLLKRYNKPLSPLKPKVNPVVVLLPKGKNSFEKITVTNRMRTLGAKIKNSIRKPFNFRGIFGLHPRNRVQRFRNLRSHLRPMSIGRPTSNQKTRNAARALLMMR